MTEYLVKLESSEEDLLRRAALIHSALYRVLHVVERLVRVESSDLRAGVLTVRVLAEEASPELVPGEVTISVEAVSEQNVRRLPAAASS